jgi:hypothetical protein
MSFSIFEAAKVGILFEIKKQIQEIITFAANYKE